ncbi:MAG: hypothetical protein JXR89_09920 [Deltaproteobacteria bacterium]|nr:hypothetical protein [Deltaproteobacteria bacterium]
MIKGQTRLLWAVCILFVACFRPEALPAKMVVMTGDGQALLEKGVETARAEAVADALGKVLQRYLYEELAVSRELEPLLQEKIFARRESFVKSYAIQNEGALGELYWIELQVELQTDLLSETLRNIEGGEKRQVEELTLVLLPPSGVENQAAAGSGVQFPALEASVLFRGLQQELLLYGFSLHRLEHLSPDLVRLCGLVLEKDQVAGASQPRVEWFQDLLPGELLILARAAEVSEEPIVSLGKSFWRSRAEMAFVDLRNRRITRLMPVEAKVIGSDYVSSLEQLTAELNLKVQKNCLDRLTRDYLLPRELDARMVLRCQGFRRPTDFAVFRERLAALRTVREVTLQALAAGLLELELRLLVPPSLLVSWLNDFAAEGCAYRFTVYPLDEAPEHYLVRVAYDLPADR